MNDTYLQIAGFNIKIKFKKSPSLFFFKDAIEKFFDGFILSKNPSKFDFLIEVAESQNLLITDQKDKSYGLIVFFQEKNNKKIVIYSYISMAQLAVVLRRIIEKLLKNRGCIIHTSASLINEKACLFMGKSGAGKSTAVRLLSKKYPILADDMGIIKEENNQLYFYQLPALEKIYFKKNYKKYPIDKIFFIKKSKQYTIKPIDNKNKLIANLLNQIRPEKEEYTKERINFIYKKLIKAKFCILEFGKNDQKLIGLFIKSTGKYSSNNNSYKFDHY
jgi:hypothetical protein